MSKDDVATIVSNIEHALAGCRFSQKKLPRLSEIIEEHFDFPALYRGLGLAA